MTKYIVFVLVAFASFGQTKAQKIVWQDDFNGNSLNQKDWNFETGDGCPNICGWGNNEKQVYTEDNHMVRDGHLVINIKRDGERYTSTRITTAAKKEFQYGRMEVRAKIPTGRGIWPAFWMLGSNIAKVGWPKCGEIDILEYVGREPDKVYTSLHTQDSHGNTVNTKKTEFKNIEEGFHLYAVDWSKEKMEFFVDNQLVYTFSPEVKNENTWPFNQPFYFIINAAVGGNFGGHDIDTTIFPQQYVIDYIRVYQ